MNDAQDKDYTEMLRALAKRFNLQLEDVVNFLSCAAYHRLLNAWTKNLKNIDTANEITDVFINGAFIDFVIDNDPNEGADVSKNNLNNSDGGEKNLN